MMLEEEKEVVSEEVPGLSGQETEVAQEVKPTSEEPKKKKKSKVRIILEWTITGLFTALFLFVAIGQVMGMIDKDKNYGHTFTYNYGSFVIQTDSMVNVTDESDSYPIGIAIITHKDNPADIYNSYLQGNKIDMTFMDCYSGQADAPQNHDYYERTMNINQVITHRLQEIQYHPEKEEGSGRYIFIVAGINRASEHQSQFGQYQAFTEKELLGVVKIKSNVLGGFFGFISSPWGLLVFLLVPAFYLVITSVLDIFKAIKEPDEENSSTSDNNSNGGNSSGSSGGSLDGLSEADKERLKREMLEEMMNRKGKK